MDVSTTSRASTPTGLPRSSRAGMRKCGCSPAQISRISAVMAAASAVPPAPRKRATAGAATIANAPRPIVSRSEEHTSELQSRPHLVCRLLLEKKKKDLQTPVRFNEGNVGPANVSLLLDACIL